MIRIWKNIWFRIFIFWPLVAMTFTLVTGFLVGLYMFKYYPDIPITYPLGINHNYIGSFIFTTSFLLINRNTSVWALKRYPIYNWGKVWLHIGIQISSTTIAYFIGMMINSLMYDKNDMNSSLPFFVFVFVMSMFAALVFNLFYYVIHFYHSTLKQSKQAAEHQLSALKNQINPHFLFNSLNSIASLIRINPEKAETVTEDLADLFRYSLRAGKQHLTTLKDEIESVETYFRIEKARFGNHIDLHLSIDEAHLDTPIPSLILQPLVENAVKHGANKMMTPCLIQIKAYQKNSTLLIEISDNGPGFYSTEKSDLFSEGTGLVNVNERIRFSFGDLAALTFEKNKVLFNIPIVKE